MRRRAGALVLLALALPACQKVSPAEAERLVERYNRAVAEAYRRGDITLVDGVVGPAEGKRLTGLIGVRLDMSMTLDADLLSLEVTGVEQIEGELRIRTQESWRYRDRRIGSGEQVGEESLDFYDMLYILRRLDGEWVVDETRFASPPQVGRTTTPWGADPRILHGVAAPQTTEPRDEEGPE